MSAEKKSPETVQPGADVPAQVGVLGGGRTGAGIAHAFAVAGLVIEAMPEDPELKRASLARIEAQVSSDASVRMVEVGCGLGR